MATVGRFAGDRDGLRYGDGSYIPDGRLIGSDLMRRGLAEFARPLYGLTAVPGVRVPPSPITSRVPSPLAAYRMPACHGRRTDCLPVRPLESTYARCDRRRRRSTHRFALREAIHFLLVIVG